MVRSFLNYFLIFGVITYSIQACIPIEDKIGPQVNPFEIQQVYFYQDTINFSVIFTDNSGLDSGSLVIEKMDDVATPGPDAWFYLDTFDIRGRRIAPDFSIAVPEYKETGDYLITVFGFDEGGNPDTVKRKFTLEADGQLPVFNDFSIDLQQVNDTLYTACRSEVINFTGYVTDNLKLSQVGFSFSNSRENNGFYSTDSLNLNAVFQDFVRIPPNTEDSTLLTLEVLAVDTFQNRSIQKFNILVACDDQPPSFEILSASPSLNPENRVKVTQGGKLTLNEMYIIENDSLRDISIFYNKSNEPLNEIVNIDLSGTKGDIKLNDYYSLSFDVPISDNLGTIREITFVATDAAGNQSALYKVYIDVIPDNPPEIIITNTYVDNRPTNFSETTYIEVSREDIISFVGKIEDANRLSLLEFYWFDESLTPTITAAYNSPLPRTINLTDYFDRETFTVPSNATLGANYILIIRVIDSIGQEAVKRYLFTVRD